MDMSSYACLKNAVKTVMLIRKTFLLFFTSCFLFFLISSPAWGISAKDKYLKAEISYKKLRHDPKKKRYKDNWLVCINRFKAVYRHDPSGPWAAAGLYMAGNLYLELYKHSKLLADKKKGIRIFEQIVKKFPKSSYKKKAKIKLFALKKPVKKKGIKKKQKKILLSKKKPSKTKRKSSVGIKSPNKTAQKPSGKLSTVTGLRFWSNPSYTRVVINGNKEIDYVDHLLKQDPSINKPKRLYIDLSKTILSKNVKKFLQVNDNLLINVRAGQYKPDSVRIVMDIKSLKSYKVFSLKNPFRLVIDVLGKNGKISAPVITKKTSNLKESALVKQFALGVKRIVIDPGHGGRDFGAPGYLKGVHEKHITLSLAKKFAKKIKAQLHCEAILTRTTDKYLTLEERTAIANTKNADLFISIHTNAAKNKRAYGIETYFLNLATDDEAILVAARENETSVKNISDLHGILNDLMHNAKINESGRLAANIQKSVCKKMKTRYSMIKNKGVKQAPFYVLLGAQMPSILFETSFISNPKECKRLTDSKYQNYICDGLILGIKKYLKEINPNYVFNRR